MKKSFIYFIRSDDAIKIGVSNRLTRRIKEMQTANSSALHLFGAIEVVRHSAFRLEALLHKMWAQFRVRGEWYRASPEIIRFVLDEQYRESIPWWKAELLAISQGKDSPAQLLPPIVSLYEYYEGAATVCGTSVDTYRRTHIWVMSEDGEIVESLKYQRKTTLGVKSLAFNVIKEAGGQDHFAIFLACLALKIELALPIIRLRDHTMLEKVWENDPPPASPRRKSVLEYTRSTLKRLRSLKLDPPAEGKANAEEIRRRYCLKPSEIDDN